MIAPKQSSDLEEYTVCGINDCFKLCAESKAAGPVHKEIHHFRNLGGFSSLGNVILMCLGWGAGPQREITNRVSY